MTIVRNSNTAGFIAGDLFTGNGIQGQVQRITDGGNTVITSWCIPPIPTSPPIGYLQGGLHVDQWNNGWQDLLYVSTGSGYPGGTGGGWLFQVWPGNMTCGKAVVLAGGPAGWNLEGITTVANDTRYGMLSDSIVCGAEYNNAIYWVNSSNPQQWNRINVGYST